MYPTGATAGKRACSISVSKSYSIWADLPSICFNAYISPSKLTNSTGWRATPVETVTMLAQLLASQFVKGISQGRLRKLGYPDLIIALSIHCFFGGIILSPFYVIARQLISWNKSSGLFNVGKALMPEICVIEVSIMASRG